MSHNYGPRHSGTNRGGNLAAEAAAAAALSGERLDALDVRRIPRSLIDPDPLNPRTIYKPAEIAALRASIEAEGQLQPIKVTPEGQRFRVLVGHQRYYATEGFEFLDAIVGKPGITDLKKLETRIAENEIRNNFTLADTCAAVHRLNVEFNLTQSYIAKNNFPIESGGKTDWVGDRVRVWKRAKDIPELVALMHDFKNVFTHAQVIVSVDDSALQRRMVKATAIGATVDDLKAMIPAKVAPMRAPEPFSKAARKTEPLPTRSIEFGRQMPRDQESRDQLSAAAATIDFGFDTIETPNYTPDTLSNKLSAIENLTNDAVKQGPIVATSATYDTTARDALKTHAARIMEKIRRLEESL